MNQLLIMKLESSNNEAKIIFPTDPVVYEKEYQYFPWGNLIDFVSEWIVSNCNLNESVYDLMCGTGRLLYNVSLKRNDLNLRGSDIEPAFVEYANTKYNNIHITCSDVRDLVSIPDVNTIICTAGLHHLSNSYQINFIQAVASSIVSGGCFLLGEEIISDYRSNSQRRTAVQKLSNAVISHLIDVNAPDDMLAAALGIQANDFFQNGEYKLCMRELEDLLRPYFHIENIVKIWPKEDDFGDFVFICRRK